MRTFKWFTIAAFFTVFSNLASGQQLALGNTPYQISKSAVLELNSDNQGLLLPRITDTASINSLNPPDGMVIYFVPTKQFLLRSNGYWKAMVTTGNYLTGLAGDVTATGPGNANATIANQAVTYSKLQNISAGNRLLGRATTGAGSAEEISLGSGLSLTGTTLNVSSLPNASLANSSITVAAGTTGTDFNISGSPVSLGGTVTLNFPNASSTARGLLTSADWNTFNNKVSTTRTLNTTAPLTGGGNLSADRTLSMTQANATTNGWLSSTDWNTFNNKQAAGNYLTGLTGDVTATGPGSAAATISNGAVTYSKMQNVSANNRLLGRATAGAGSVEEISLGSGLSMSGNTLNVGTVSIAQGGTGQTTANAALNALLPSQTGNFSKFLATDGANASWTPIALPSSTDYLFSYSTTTQSWSGPTNVWQDILFDAADPVKDNWTHSTTSNSQNFICNRTGIYQVVYSAQIHNNAGGSTQQEMDIRATVNGVEVPGSVCSAMCASSDPTLTGNFLMTCNAGQVLKLQMIATSTSMQLKGPRYGDTKPSITITIIRLK